MRLLEIDFTKSKDEINKQLQFNRLIAEAALYGMKLKDSYVEQSGIKVTDYQSSKPTTAKNETSNDDVQSEILKTVKETSQKMSEIQGQLSSVIAGGCSVRIING